MEMKFNAAIGKRVVLRGMSNDTPNIVTTKQMESIFRNDEASWVVTCLNMTHKYSN